MKTRRDPRNTTKAAFLTLIMAALLAVIGCGLDTQGTAAGNNGSSSGSSSSSGGGVQCPSAPDPTKDLMAVSIDGAATANMAVLVSTNNAKVEYRDGTDHPWTVQIPQDPRSWLIASASSDENVLIKVASENDGPAVADFYTISDSAYQEFDKLYGNNRQSEVYHQGTQLALACFLGLEPMPCDAGPVDAFLSLSAMPEQTFKDAFTGQRIYFVVAKNCESPSEPSQMKKSPSSKKPQVAPLPSGYPVSRSSSSQETSTTLS
jgi:hypothetical protein